MRCITAYVFEFAIAAGVHPAYASGIASPVAAREEQLPVRKKNIAPTIVNANNAIR
jgi:hypothetical protein